MHNNVKQCSAVFLLFFNVVTMGFINWACQPKKEGEIRIGLSAIMTGPQAAGQQPTLEAAKLAVREINNSGGLKVGEYKHKVVLITEDSEDRAEKAVSTVTRLINQEGAVAIIGPNMSRNAIPVAAVCEKARIPMISTGSTNPETTAGKKYVFRACFVDDFQGKILAQFAYHDLGFRKAAVLYDIASVYNREIAEVFKQVFEERGGAVVAFETYTSDQNQDFSRQMTNIKKSEPDVLFLPNYLSDIVLQVHQARQTGVTATFLGSDSWGQLGSEDLKEQIFEGSFFSNAWHKNIANSQSQGFVKGYNREYENEPRALAALTYDAFGLLFRAIQDQGKTDPESIRKGLSSISDYKGVTGTISFNGSGDPVKSAVILQIKKGKPVFHKLVNP